MLYKEITEKIIGCAYTVYNKMGFGFLESVYENCMMIELAKQNIKSESQKDIIVRYEEKIVGQFRADILAGDSIVIEIKSVSQLNKAHETQLVNYLVATGKDIGLLINFGQAKVEVKRKVRELGQLKDE